MNALFGTDGIRGVANTELTPELTFRLGRAAALYAVQAARADLEEGSGVPLSAP